MNKFLEDHGWSVVKPLAEDGSARRYSRVERNGKKAIFMEVLGQTPGHDLKDFIKIGSWLRDVGLSAPEIYEADEKSGWALLEDFGDLSFLQARAQGAAAEELYMLAINVLDHLATQDCPLDLPLYGESHVHAGHRKVVDFYIPSLRGEKNPQGTVQAYLGAWAEIEKSLPPCSQNFLHIDFHAENLMWRPGETGLKCCGILDFQGAMHGPKPYDLGNLLEDARAHVPDELKDEALLRYSANERAWYRILTTQFHCRVMGQFIQLAKEQGKTGYLDHLPRLAFYMDQALKDPLLEPLRAFFADLKVDFSGANTFNADALQSKKAV